MSSLRLSPSAVQLYLNCPRMYRYRKVWRWQAVKIAANLVFGRVIDAVIMQTLKCFASRHPVPDPARMFTDLWDAEIAKQPLEFTNKAMGPIEMRMIGASLAEQFPQRWLDSGLTVATLPDGSPALQVELDASFGDGLGYKVILDALAFDQEGDLGIVDFKTAASSALQGFDSLAPQITDYQVVAEANGQKLGIEDGDVRWGRFIELLKKSTPTIDFRQSGRRRTDEEVAERVADIRGVARDIRAGHYPRRPGMAFNSPCRMCEFRNHCLTNSTEGLNRPKVGTAVVLPEFDFDLSEFDDAA